MIIDPVTVTLSRHNMETVKLVLERRIADLEKKHEKARSVKTQKKLEADIESVATALWPISVALQHGA